jgi:anthranilate 1,2-dioxygenase small subunit
MAALDPAEFLRIDTFLTGYAHGLDDGLTDDWPSFFAEDGVYQITTRENHEAGYPIGIMLCEGRGMMQDRMLALRTANVYEPQALCHILGRPEVHEESPGIYAARSNFSVFRTMESGEASLFATGKYLDRIVLQDGVPRFKARRVILDSRCIDVLLVVPL